MISGVAGLRGSSAALVALVALVAQECNEVTVQSDEVEAGHGWTWQDMAGLHEKSSDV